jgi:hypothetical protein
VRGFLVIIFVILCPAVVLSHPGKTDKRGGHRCWKGCSEWQLGYGEYHLHDKDFMPIRLKKIRNTVLTSDPRRIQDPAAPVAGSQEVVKESHNEPQQSRYVGTSLAKSPEKTYPDEDLTSLSECDLALFAFALGLIMFLLWRRKRRPGAAVQ